MAQAQKPGLILQRNGRVHLNWQGGQFSRLLAADLCASAVVMVVMLDTSCSEVECKTTGYPLHSHVSPSLPLPCVTVCHQVSTELYQLLDGVAIRNRSVSPRVKIASEYSLRCYHLFTYLVTYFLTPWCRALLEKLTGLQLVKKFHAFHGTRRFITALTSFRHLSLSWTSPIQSVYPHPTSWRSILILSTHLRLGLPSGFFPSDFPTKTLYTPSPHPYASRAQSISFFSILSPAQYWVRSTDHLAPRCKISSRVVIS